MNPAASWKFISIDCAFAIIRSDKDLSFKFDSTSNPTEDTFFYAGVVKTFDLFSN